MVDALAQSLLNMGLNELRPVMILSGNSIEHALMIMAAMQAGVPAAPISVAYSLVSQDHAKLRLVFEIVKPGFVFVQSGAPFQRALAALNLKRAGVAYVDDAPSGLDAVSYSELAATSVGEAVERAYTAVGPKTVAKYLFTSGSTGFPKAVKAGHKITRIAIAFETGRDGFWLARWLRAHGIEAHVIHAASVPVSREHRRAKTDYGDGDDELPSKGPKGGQRPSPGRRRRADRHWYDISAMHEQP